jgi:hypothetical protein
MRIKLPLKRFFDLQVLCNALGTVQAMVGPVAKGETFRRRLAKHSDEELQGFLRAVKRLVRVLEPLQIARIDVELEAEAVPPDIARGPHA